jgi:hypothetical protein
MAVKYVNEYVEEMCDICYEFRYGIFVKMNEYQQICKVCCDEISKQLKIYELENS